MLQAIEPANFCCLFIYFFLLFYHLVMNKIAHFKGPGTARNGAQTSASLGP